MFKKNLNCVSPDSIYEGIESLSQNSPIMILCEIQNSKKSKGWVMAKCDACGSTIIFGGIQQGNYHFCSEACLEKENLMIIGGSTMEGSLNAGFQGKCPKCGGEGPINIHTSYFVWSALIFTSWKSTPNICCKSCGVKDQALSAVGSFFLGWWGLPWGIIMTPVQIIRNIAAIIRDP
jgi:hypothetical protein